VEANMSIVIDFVTSEEGARLNAAMIFVGCGGPWMFLSHEDDVDGT
jgi:hypothetical protein